MKKQQSRGRADRRRRLYQERKRANARKAGPFKAGYRHWLMGEFYDVGSGGRFDTPRNRRANAQTPEQNIAEWIGDWGS